jgi:hypothetical protein
VHIEALLEADHALSAWEHSITVVFFAIIPSDRIEYLSIRSNITQVLKQPSMGGEQFALYRCLRQILQTLM